MSEVRTLYIVEYNGFTFACSQTPSRVDNCVILGVGAATRALQEALQARKAVGKPT